MNLHNKISHDIYCKTKLKHDLDKRVEKQIQNDLYKVNVDTHHNYQ
jgi:hypothetical protein